MLPGFRLVLPLLLMTPPEPNDIVIRHDVDDAQYLVSEAEFPALVDLHHEGHGVLIAPQWVVTAAHATQWHPVTAVMLNGKCRTVERVIVHPGYKQMREELLSGDVAPLMRFLASSDDIALIKLVEPVADVAPVAIHIGDDELGRLVKLYGKGATGNGRVGQTAHGANRTALRRAYNTVSSANGNWLGYVFDEGAAAHELEGILGDGDSGGPVLINVDGAWELAGLASWKYGEGEITQFRAGLYGQISYNVRVSRYADWIHRVLATEGG